MPADDRVSGVRATIVVPSFNHARWVVEAVRSALDQTERDVEVVVIDDGSTDDSLARLATIADPRLEIVTQPNAGLSNTLNRGLARARGRWVKFVPSDDVLEPECIARQLAAAERAPGARLVFALPTVVDADGAGAAVVGAVRHCLRPHDGPEDFCAGADGGPANEDTA